MTAPANVVTPQPEEGRWRDRSLRMRPRTAAIVGLVMAVPIGLLFLAVIVGLQPLGDALRAVLTTDGSQPNTLGRVYMLVGLLLLPVALGVTTWPMIRPIDDRRRLYVANIAVAAVIGLLIWVTWGELAVEVVRCDVMGIPNCD
ncbi:MAG TPA: hypothetical protein VIF84_08980 [Candidatus Limnocylindrales bacterium]|jgi:hypothetical protein